MFSRVFLKPLCRHYNTVNHPTKNNPEHTLKIFVTRSLLGVTAGAIAYDGFNEFPVFGGIIRFIRSLKIAAVISVDYSVNLYGLESGTTEYEQVRK